MAHKIQSFNFYQLGRCFSTKGRRTHPAPPLKSSPVKVVGLDGRVKVYHRRIKVEELMKENAFHLVCRSDSFFIGQKLQALEAAEELQMGESYFILPSQFFQSVLSFVTIAASLARIGGSCGGRDGGGRLRHFDIHKTDSGKLQIRINEEVEEEGKIRVLCTTEEMEKEYEKLVGVDLRRWRPKLEKIAETAEGKMRRRRRDLKFRSFGGFRRKNTDKH